MAWSDSISATPVFVDSEPDWSQDVKVIQKWSTDVQSAFSGAEQRARRRVAPRWETIFEVRLQPLPFSVIRSRMQAELQAPVVVPIWTRYEGLSGIASNVATLDAAITKSPFKVGSYAYFVESGKTSVFRRITAKGTSTITLASGNAAWPDITPPTYTSAAIVYPCILGLRDSMGADFYAIRHDATQVIYHVTEL